MTYNLKLSPWSRLEALQADFGQPNFTISAPLPGSTTGSPLTCLDWITFTGSFFSSINAGVRKSGANLLTLSQLGSDAGFKDVVSAGNISWTGGTPTASGSTGGVGLTQQSQTVGNGMRIEYTIGSGPHTGRWPDVLQLRVIDLCYSVRQVNYTASIIGDPEATTVTEYIGSVNEDNNGFMNQINHVTDFFICSKVPGSVARLDLKRGAGSMGNWQIGYAIMLYIAPTQSPNPYRGGTQAIIGSSQ